MRLTGATLDRLTHRVGILALNGENFRLCKSRITETRNQETLDLAGRLAASAPWNASAAWRTRAPRRRQLATELPGFTPGN